MKTLITYITAMIWVIIFALFSRHCDRRRDYLRNKALRYAGLVNKYGSAGINAEYHFLMMIAADKLKDGDLVELRREIVKLGFRDPAMYGHPKKKHLGEFLRFCRKHSLITHAGNISKLDRYREPKDTTLIDLQLAIFKFLGACEGFERFQRKNKLPDRPSKRRPFR